MTEDIRKLLGGYATGTLTEEEREALFGAALQDQSLFEALADEQALKELLDNPTARGELLRAADSRHFSATSLFAEWFDRPKAKVLVGVCAVLLMAIVVRETSDWRRAAPPASQTVAEVRAPAAPQSVPSEPPAAPDKLQSRAPALTARRTKRAEAKQPSAGEVKLAAPETAAAVSPPRPPAEEASPEASTRVASADGLQMKYTVLLRNRAGEYIAVPPEHQFTQGDRVRIRVETSRPGMLSVKGSGDAQAVTIRNVRAGSPVVLPTDIAFDDSQRSKAVRITFLADAELLRGIPAERYSRQDRSVEPRVNSLASPENPGATTRKTNGGPGVLTLDITLEEKQP
jgi:hypothetical protein